MTSIPATYHVYYDEENKFVVMKWSGYATSFQFREGTQLMLDTLTEHKSAKVLADVQHMLLIGMSDQHWLEHVLLPKAIEAGFKALAIVSPVNHFNKVAFETIAESINSEKLQVQLFSEPAEAGEWLGFL